MSSRSFKQIAGFSNFSNSFEKSKIPEGNKDLLGVVCCSPLLNLIRFRKAGVFYLGETVETRRAPRLAKAHLGPMESHPKIDELCAMRARLQKQIISS